MDLLLENISHEDFKKYLKQFYNYAKKKLNIERAPKVFFKRDIENSKDFFGKTAYYDPDNEEIHLFLSNRHAKDVIRSFAHELIHHCQKLEGKNDDLDLSVTHDPAYASKDPKLRNMERDAFERGNMVFRDWTDKEKSKRKKIMSETKNKKVSEGSKPDFLDLDKDGNKKEPMKKAAKQARKDKKNMKKNIHKKAQAEAKEDMKKRTGKDMQEIDEQSDNEQVGAVPTNENFQLPYQQLFDEKERLLGKVFNKREDIVYQELIRRFIKK